ncbi:putative methyltransferase C9orf114 homolog [Microplitis demolitor]|uniref:putative methyltransferase C9orf114 homolog n=1 Tax=Microplitis demolitor TaxID=69319 RepID=UPI0004CCC625|nr:putative methyltransferase C9orf114 homolog [Microplitis demolitor]
MAAAIPLGKSWKEHNKIHKENRKKWREQKLMKKISQTKEPKVEEVLEEEKISSKVKKIVPSLTIAVPGSILDNAQSQELRTYLAGQIARAACVYKVDEIVVFDDQGEITEEERQSKRVRVEGVDNFAYRRACLQLARILQYLECPQYLRKYFFPLHKDLQYAGVLNPLDAPHHLRQNDHCEFREGVVVDKPLKPGRGSQVNCGLLRDVEIDKTLTPDLRVTVRIPEEQEGKKIKGLVVSPRTPREEGLYWGYTVRLARSLTEIFEKCPYEEGYDLTVGTSDKGKSVDEIEDGGLKYKRGLIVFGGLAGLEAAVEGDPKLDIEDPRLLFGEYVNTCPDQGSRTIRTEEAIFITLAEMRKKMVPVSEEN